MRTAKGELLTRPIQVKKYCVICEKNDFRILYPFEDLNIVSCSHCGLVTTTHLLKGADLERIYTSTYYDDRSEYFFRNSIADRTVDEENTNILDFRRGLKTIEEYKSGGKLLDVGCGVGIFLTLARERGWKVHGVDISKFAASYARDVFGLDTFAGQLHEARYPDKWFDAITLWDVIEHLPEPSQLLREVNRILKNDGIVFVNTPNQAGFLRLLADIIYRISGGAISYPVRKLYHEFHLCYFTPQTLQNLLYKNNFVIERLEKRCIPILKARGVPLERMIVKLLSWPERIFHKEYELWVFFKKHR